MHGTSFDIYATVADSLNGLDGLTEEPMVVYTTEPQRCSRYVSAVSPIAMSYWEQNWRRNLKLITVDETPQSQQLQVSRWLKFRCEHLLGCSSDLEAECLIEEFDDVEYS